MARLGAGGTLRWERLYTQVGALCAVDDIALCSGGVCAAGDTWDVDGDGLVVRFRR